MAFRLVQNPTFKTTIVVHTLNEKCSYDKSSFVAEFKRPSMNRFEAVKDNDVLLRDYIRSELIGWSDLKGDADEEVPFTPENVEALFDIVEAVNAMIDQYIVAIKTAREKNLKK